MTSAVQHVPSVCTAPSASWGWRLLARLAGFARRRLSSLNPEELPPHLLRDLGLADRGFRGRLNDSRPAPLDRLIR